MPVDYDFAEMFLAQQKIVADPQQVLMALLCERDAGSYARMDEIVVAAGKSYGQAVQKKPMTFGQRLLESHREF
jgi:hypothetical protein